MSVFACVYTSKNAYNFVFVLLSLKLESIIIETNNVT